ncbi:hypothetical protein BG20_I2112 [Candidatus Nitrosarchaeum limnium BG20]|uniref:Uncharacterized protein n=1 Tax=Candidatus Nitrosarchaeum limnium BG20 TaxID=859192 RepID=S2E4N5_9ARCH|nr:hypothetical protein BG20_I2112 [Candidatus Nitrosarchaeum limnium BG20]
MLFDNSLNYLKILDIGFSGDLYQKDYAIRPESIFIYIILY